jgi:uncharacterized protein
MLTSKACLREAPIGLVVVIGILAMFAAFLISEYPGASRRPARAARILAAAAQGNQRELDDLIHLYSANDELVEELEGALRMAAMYGQDGTAKLLLKRGVNPNCSGSRGITPLMCVAYGADLRVAARLIEAGADVDAADADGRTALMEAAAVGNDRLVQLLVEAGADVHMVDSEGTAAVREAAE